MSALFNIESMITLIFLFICMSTYLKRIWPNKIMSFREGFSGLLRNASIVGERLSPLVSIGCMGLAWYNLFVRA